MLPLIAGYQPLTDSRAIRRCPLPCVNENNRLSKRDGRLHYKLPVTPSAQIQATDRSSPSDSVPGSTEVPSDTRTLGVAATSVKGYPYLFDSIATSQVGSGRGIRREIQLRRLAKVMPQAGNEPADDSPGCFRPSHDLQTASHRQMCELIVRIKVSQPGSGSNAKVGVGHQPRILG